MSFPATMAWQSMSATGRVAPCFNCGTSAKTGTDHKGISWSLWTWMKFTSWIVTYPEWKTHSRSTAPVPGKAWYVSFSAESLQRTPDGSGTWWLVVGRAMSRPPSGGTSTIARPNCVPPRMLYSITPISCPCWGISSHWYATISTLLASVGVRAGDDCPHPWM